MDYLKILHENPDLAEEFDSLFDFFLLDELSPRDEAEGRCTFSLPGMAFARDGSGGEYHLLEDGSIGYYSSEGEAGRLVESMDMDVDSWRRVADALGIPTGEPLAPVLERFRKATQREPLYRCIFHEDDGSLTESYGLMFE